MIFRKQDVYEYHSSHRRFTILKSMGENILVFDSSKKVEVIITKDFIERQLNFNFMFKSNNLEDRHIWQMKYDEEEKNMVDYCLKCEIKRRSRQNFLKGTLNKAGKILEYLVNGIWTIEHPKCK